MQLQTGMTVVQHEGYAALMSGVSATVARGLFYGGKAYACVARGMHITLMLLEQDSMLLEESCRSCRSRVVLSHAPSYMLWWRCRGGCLSRRLWRGQCRRIFPYEYKGMQCVQSHE